MGNENERAAAFHNKGDGTFEDIAPAAGVDRGRFHQGCGRPVIMTTTGTWISMFPIMNGDNYLFHNNHNRTFTEVVPWQG